MYGLTDIVRRKSTRVYVGKIPIGDGAPIAVQSMVNTNTMDVKSTVDQINALKKAGVDIVRISVPTMDAAEAFKIIKEEVNTVPLVADIHFDYRIALKVAEYGADCLRINPGNIGNSRRVRSVVHCAQDKNIPIRIGVNSGSLEYDLRKNKKMSIERILFESAMRHIDILNKLDFQKFKVSVKSSDVLSTVKAYRYLASEIDQPLHVGLTESGALRNGTVKSSMALGFLLSEGIGDTIRVSLAADPVEEVKVAFDILRALNIRVRGINFIACPGCARQEFDVINVVNILEKKMSDIVVPMDVSIIGCVVNGPGEAEKATIGIAGARNKSGVYEDGVRQKERCDNKLIAEELERRIRVKSDFIKKNNNNYIK